MHKDILHEEKALISLSKKLNSIYGYQSTNYNYQLIFFCCKTLKKLVLRYSSANIKSIILVILSLIFLTK